MCPFFCSCMHIIASDFLLPTFSTVKSSSVVAVQIFDQHKFKRRDQGFLGVANIQLANYMDLELRNHGTFSSLGLLPTPFRDSTDALLKEVVQLGLDLKKTYDNLVVQGRLVIHLSTDLSMSATISSSIGPLLALTTHPSNVSSPFVNDTSAAGIVSPGQTMGLNTSMRHNFNATENQYGPLPKGWELVMCQSWLRALKALD